MQKYILNIIYNVVIHYFLKLIIGVKYENMHYLKESEQFIIIANHNSHLDAMAIMSAIPSRLIHKVHPVAANDYFGKGKIRSFFSRYFINTLLISRNKEKGNDCENPIKLMLEVLDKGHSLILFPEGTRGEPEIMQKFKKGIGVVLKERPFISYIPVYMYGMGKTMPKGDVLIVPFNSLVRIGKPQKTESDNPEEIVSVIEENILNLKMQS